MVDAVAAVMMACGDNGRDSNPVTNSDEDSSSSVCDDYDGSSSSSKDVMSSSKGSSSSKNGDAATHSSSSGLAPAGMTSSSAKSSSSSAALNSSSSDGITSCDVNNDENCMKDERDGQTYKTVTIGTQSWMAENLNYAYTSDPFKYSDQFDGKQRYFASDSTSWCFENNLDNCSRYGRFYTWAAAMDSMGTWSTNGKECGRGTKCSPTYPVRGICPEGWHLPSETEWDMLFAAVGGKSIAGKMLKSTSGWKEFDGVDRNGTDAYAFSALPVGFRSFSGEFNTEGFNAAFWSSTEENRSSAYNVDLSNDYDKAFLRYDGKNNGFSVRCVKD